MAKIRITCPKCRQSFKCSSRYRGTQISCPSCKHLVHFSRRSWKKLLVGLLVPVLLIVLLMVWLIWPMGIQWKDRRPIGALFLASNYHASATNPRGWFNDQSLDFVGPGGKERFRKMLMDYANSSISNLTRLGAQGVIVWDLEGEQYPHKTSFIGDPRTLDQLAPEMAPVADEFFKRFRDAGLRVGVTIRPQELDFDTGFARQTTVFDIKDVLLDKIDYAQKHWGATLFYLDSNDSVWRPDEGLQLRLVAQARPDILLIPEHHYLPYWAFSAPYVSLQRGNGDVTTGLARTLIPRSFQVLDIASASKEDVMAALHQGDIPLFRAWFWNPDCEILESLQQKQK